MRKDSGIIMEKLEEFIRTLESLKDTLDSVTAIEQAKARAAAAGQPKLLDEYIRGEQAAILKMRGLEQSRIRLGEELGWKDLTFRQIIARAGEADRARLAPLFERLEESLRALLSAKDASDRMIKVRLHELEAVTSRAFPQGLTAEWRI